MTTGMIIPGWLDVFALNCLQKSIILIPLDSALPTGRPVSPLRRRFAVSRNQRFSLPCVIRELFFDDDLRKIQFDGRFPPENAYFHFQFLFFLANVLDRAGKIVERSVDDFHRITTRNDVTIESMSLRSSTLPRIRRTSSGCNAWGWVFVPTKLMTDGVLRMTSLMRLSSATSMIT